MRHPRPYLTFTSIARVREHEPRDVGTAQQSVPFSVQSRCFGSMVQIKIRESWTCAKGSNCVPTTERLRSQFDLSCHSRTSYELLTAISSESATLKATSVTANAAETRRAKIRSVPLSPHFFYRTYSTSGRILSVDVIFLIFAIVRRVITAQAACFVVPDHNGQALAYVYFKDEPGRRSARRNCSRATRRGCCGKYRQATGGFASDLARTRTPIRRGLYWL